MDVSEPSVALANAYASALELPARFETWDLEARGFPPGPWGAILLFRFLDRRLFARLPDCLCPGGLLAIRTHLAHPLRNPWARPRRAEHLLHPGELLDLAGLEILDYREAAAGGESWAALLARRAAPARFSPRPPPGRPPAPRS